MERNGGFTLVELIVVIAILAILAGLAVPSYTGYVRRAEDAEVLASLREVLIAAQAANINGSAISKIEVSGDGMKITVSDANDLDEEFNTQFCGIYGCPLERNNIGVIYSTDVQLINLEHSAYEKGAVWYASDEIAPEGYRGGWNPVK